jgi:hypothetical protein
MESSKSSGRVGEWASGRVGEGEMERRSDGENASGDGGGLVTSPSASERALSEPRTQVSGPGGL